MQGTHGTEEPADRDPVFDVELAPRRHKGLKKHESSLLTQIRTGKVGLRAFLFSRKVPEVNTPLCPCGRGEETPAHLVIHCSGLTEERERLRRELAPHALRTSRDFAAITADRNRAPIVVKWLLATGRFPEFRLARRYAALQDHEAARGALGEGE